MSEFMRERRGKQTRESSDRDKAMEGFRRRVSEGVLENLKRVAEIATKAGVASGLSHPIRHEILPASTAVNPRATMENLNG